MSTRLVPQMATLLLLATLITCTRGGFRYFDRKVYNGLKKLDNWLAAKSPLTGNAGKSIELIENYVKSPLPPKENNGELVDAMQALLTIIKAKDCDDIVLSTFDNVLISLKFFKNLTNFDRVLKQADSKLRAKCTDKIKSKFEESKAQLNLQLVDKFNDLVRPSSDWNRHRFGKEPKFDYLMASRYHMPQDQLYKILFQIIREQKPELGVVKISGNTIQLNENNARAAYHELLLKPCRHLKDVFGRLFEQLDTLRETAESDYELRQTLSYKMSDEFKEFNYRHKNCNRFDEVYNLDYYFFKDLFRVLEDKFKSSKNWRWDEIFWKMHPKDDYEQKYYSMNQ